MRSVSIASATRVHTAMWLSVPSSVENVLENMKRNSQCSRATSNLSSRRHGTLSNWRWSQLAETRNSSSFSENTVKKETQFQRSILQLLPFTTERSSALRQKISNSMKLLLLKMHKSSPSVAYKQLRPGLKMSMNSMQCNRKLTNWLKRQKQVLLLSGGRFKTEKEKNRKMMELEEQSE